MPVQSFAQKVKQTSNYRLERELNSFVFNHRSFRNLSPSDRKILLELLEKYRQLAVRGRPITDYSIRRDISSLHTKRISLGLTRKDIDDIRDILNAFKTH